jgi:hypothetical protein
MTTMQAELAVKKYRRAVVFCLLFSVILTTLLIGCKTVATSSRAVVSIKVLDQKGLIPVTNAVLSAVHPLSSDLVEAKTDETGRAVLRFRFIAHRFVIGLRHYGERAGTITIVPDQGTTNIIGEAWLNFETEIDARRGTVSRKRMLRDGVTH